MSEPNLNFNRIVYSPEVQVYILPGGKDAKPIDISNDIIEGNITRRTEAVSTASFLVQSRRNKQNEMTLGTLLRPMDRIVVYLKKTKPILIFSGYLDLVPVFQAMPEPFVIEASCTLKRLEFTYWDPNLPKVYETLQRYGFIPQVGEGGVSFFAPVAPSGTTQVAPTASGPQATTGNFPQDTGFAAMLNFLLVDVGGWDQKSIWIEPLPEAWMQRAALLFQVNNDWEDRMNLAQDWLKTFLTSGGTSGGSPTSDVSGGSSSSAKLTNRSEIVSIIDSKIKKYGTVNGVLKTDIKGEDFVKYGEYYNIDPRFLAAIAHAETSYGLTGQGRDPSDPPDARGTRGYFNMYGLGTRGRVMPSRAESVRQAAIQIREEDYYLKPDPNQTIDGWIVNWTQGLKSHRDAVAKSWQEMQSSGNPVDTSKPYTIVGQGIGTDEGPVDPDSDTDTTDNPSSTTGGGNTKLSVYVEVGHSGGGGSTGAVGGGLTTRQPGYQGMPGGAGELQNNLALVSAIERVYNALSESEKARIDITFAKETSRPAGWSGDVYLSIHHDPDSFNSNYLGIAGPSNKSKQGTTVNVTPHPSKQGEPGPNRYAPPQGGSGFTLPSEGEGGRDRIDNDTNLHSNSGSLISLITQAIKEVSFKNQKHDVVNYSSAAGYDWNRMQNYYGFYYTNSSAAAIIEFPSSKIANPKPLYDEDKIAKALVRGLLKYQKFIKVAGKQKQVKGGTEGSGARREGAGDNSYASKLIRACVEIAKYNEKTQKIGYSMNEGDGKDARSPGNKFDKIKANGWAMDCSSFICNGMLTAGFGEGYQKITTGLWSDSDTRWSSVEEKKENIKAGHLFIKGKNTGRGAAGHVVLVTNPENNECVHCTSSGIRGPQMTTAEKYINDSEYDLCEHNLIGNTTDPPSGIGSGSGEGESANNFLQAKTVAFNVAFNFPGSLLESVLLTGDRALENDVKLFESVAEICKASMRTFASLPNGDFMAWYPDYFNLSGRNPWLRVNTTEIKSCTISLSDRQLVTHVYVLGNPLGFSQADAGRINVEWYEKLLGAGVVTIERPYILDSFLRPFENEDLTQEDIDSLEDISKLTAEQIMSAKKRPREILEGQGAAYKFLERYGARPYLEKIPTIRHPIFEFFYAYHTFIQKWAEQFITRVDLTFMPELFPGMIVELEVNPVGDIYSKTSITFYVKEVTHSFSYQNGFYTEVLLMAPGTTNTGSGNDWAMTLVRPPDGFKVDESRKKRLRVKVPPKKKPTTGGSKAAKKPGSATKRGEDGVSPIDTDDGSN